MRHAIVGAGFGAAAHLPAFAGLPGVEVVAVADGGSGGAARLMRPGLATYSDWRRMLDEARPDSLTVAVPPAAQAAVVGTALERGIHVLCEKPLGRDPDEAAAMTAQAEAAGTVNAVCFQYRFEAGMAELRREIAAGRIGRLRRADISWLTAGRSDPARPWAWQHDTAQGGGVLNGFVSHLADLLTWLTGAMPVAAVARMEILVSSRPDAAGSPRAVTAEDQVDALIEFGDDMLATIRVSNCQPGGDGLSIALRGDAGVLEFAHRPPFDAAPEVRFCGRYAAALAIEIPLLEEAGADSRIAPLRRLAGRFVDAVRGGPAGELPSFRDGLRAQRLLAAVRRAAAGRMFAAV